jgi:MFS family permease
MPKYQEYSWLYAYTLGGGALCFFAAGSISDKISRKWALCFFILISLLEFALLVAHKNLEAILISPLYASTPVAMASIVDNHKRRSVKKLMCVAFACLFAPWCVFRKISSFLAKWEDFVILAVVLTILAFLFKDLKDLKESKENLKKPHFQNSKWFFILNIALLSIGLLGADTVFYQVAENAEKFNYGPDFFEFINRGLLCGTILCFFVSGDVRRLTYVTYAFLLLLSICSYLAFYYWGIDAWRLSFTYLGVLGGFYLPTVAEIFVGLFGEKSRGKAIGLTLFLTDVASLISLLFLKKEQLPLYSLRVIILSAIITFISQTLYENFNKKRIKLKK